MTNSAADVDHLADRMLRSMREELAKVRWAAPEHIRHERIAIQRSFGPAAVTLSTDAAEQRLLDLYEQGIPTNPAALRDCLASLHMAINVSGDDSEPEVWSPIESPVVFNELVATASLGALTPRWRDRCMASLLHSYLMIDGPEAKRSNPQGDLARHWQQIAEALLAYAQDHDNGRVGALLATHRSVLGAEPAREFGSAALDGDDELLDKLGADLSIPESSWFWRELLIAQADELRARPDAEFERAWPHLLREAKSHPGVREAVLGKILDRYLRGGRREENEELRDLAFEWWKNPLLESNKTRWLAYVQPSTYEGVLNWIKLRLIDEFFEYLADDPSTDQRRPQFWKGYVDHIEDIIFFLGENARETLQLNNLRTRMAQKVRRIAHPDSAFAMVIGKRVYFEFSSYGNALYEYPAANLEYLPKGTIPLSAVREEHWRSELAHLMKNPINRWVHSGNWPANFADRIYALSHVRPTRSRKW